MSDSNSNKPDDQSNGKTTNNQINSESRNENIDKLNESSNNTSNEPVSESKRSSPFTSKSSTLNKSRKLQGIGMKKPIYSKYESVFIIKAFKTIQSVVPNLVLLDIFKIVSILFNKESIYKNFKTRTSDQLYQKYKRIIHGLNNGELEYKKFFKQNELNPKEWLPIDITSIDEEDADQDEPIDEQDEDVLTWSQIEFKDLEKAIKEVTEGLTTHNENGNNHDINSEDELLKLAGYDNVNQQLQIELKNYKLKVENLEKLNNLKDQEIVFLKELIKGDLNYIRQVLTD